MAGLDGLIKNLREAEKTLASQLSSVQSAISTLTAGGRESVGDLVKETGHRPERARKRRRRKLSAEGRAAIAAAQRKRWAKIKAAKKSKQAAPST
jgi:hypothetical protein